MGVYTIETPSGTIDVEAADEAAAMAGAKDWHSKQPGPSVALDVGKQMAVAPARAFESMVSAPADIANMLSRPIQGSMNYLAPSDPNNLVADDKNSHSWLTSQEQIDDQAKLRQLGLEARGGSKTVLGQYLPEAKTEPGKLAGKVVEGVTQMAGSPGKAMVNALGGVGVGAGDYIGEKFDSPTAHLISVLLGGTAGLKAGERVGVRQASKLSPSTEAIEGKNKTDFADIRSEGNTQYVPQKEMDNLQSDIHQTIGMEGPRETTRKFDDALANVNKPYFSDKLTQVTTDPAVGVRGNMPVSRTESVAAGGLPDVHDLVSKEKEMSRILTEGSGADKAAAYKAREMIQAKIGEKNPELLDALLSANKDSSIAKSSQALDAVMTNAEIAGRGKWSGLGAGDAY